MQRHVQNEQGNPGRDARRLRAAAPGCPRQAPGHALRLRRRVAPVVVGRARWRRRSALPGVRAAAVVRAHTASKEAVYREDRRPPACHSPLPARLPRSNALNTGTSGRNSAIMARHATSPRSQPTWSAKNSSRRLMTASRSHAAARSSTCCPGAASARRRCRTRRRSRASPWRPRRRSHRTTRQAGSG